MFPIEEEILISIDIPALKSAKVSDEEMQARKERWQPREPKVNYRGYLARYAFYGNLSGKRDDP